jgi:phosphatidylglycerophosphatase A
MELFFEVEGLRINVRSILSRLETLLAHRPALYASGPYDFVVREEATLSGWQVAQKIEDAGIFILFAPGDPITFEYLENVVQSMPHILGGCIVRESEKRERSGVLGAWSIQRPFTPYHTIAHYIHYLARRLRLPRFLIAFFTRLCRSPGITEIAGERCFKVRARNNYEMYFGRGPTPAQHLLKPRFDLRDVAMSFFWIGHFGVAPGTVASILTTAALMGVWSLQSALLTLAAGLMALLSTLLCVVLEPWSAKRYFSRDARQVVLDEVAGQSLLIALMPPLTSPWQFLAALVLFRIFDILKPGVYWIEKCNIRGTIVWDDLLAGIYGAACAWIMALAGLWPFR